MTKVSYGEYAAFDTKGSIRYQQNNRLVSKSALPPEVVTYLDHKMLEADPSLGAEPAPEAPAPQFAKPSPEELAKMRADSIAGLQNEGVAYAPAEPLAADDFDPSLGETSHPENRAATEFEMSEEMKAEVSSDYLESVSIHTASVEDMARAMYDRFGIYSVYLNQFPQTDEINPLTGVVFSKYHQGIAYQGLIAARSTGVFTRPAELGREQIVEGRVAHEQYEQAVAQNNAESRAAPDRSSFAYRTSPASQKETPATHIVHTTDPVTGEVRAERSDFRAEDQYTGRPNNSRQRFDSGEDEVLVEPKFGEQIIRPNW